MASTRKVGRPIEKQGRVKIGLSVNGEANDLLNELVKRTGKTKSRIFEEAIKVMKAREEIIYARMLDYEKNGDNAFLNIDELLKNKNALDKEQEVKNVG